MREYTISRFLACRIQLYSNISAYILLNVIYVFVFSLHWYQLCFNYNYHSNSDKRKHNFLVIKFRSQIKEMTQNIFLLCDMKLWIIILVENNICHSAKTGRVAVKCEMWKFKIISFQWTLVLFRKHSLICRNSKNYFFPNL